MAKYSTDRGDGGGNGGNRGLCGRSAAKLRCVNVVGADPLICPNYASHSENHHADRKSGSSDASRGGSSGNRKKCAARRTTKLYDSAKGDSKHWEEKRTDYEKNRLPYLASGHGGVVEPARQDAGLQLTEFADKLDPDEKRLFTIKQGRATRVGVRGLAIRAPEECLSVTLVDK